MGDKIRDEALRLVRQAPNDCSYMRDEARNPKSHLTFGQAERHERMAQLLEYYIQEVDKLRRNGPDQVS